MAHKQKSGGGARKIGRTADKCKREKNKDRKLKKHIERQPKDLVAKTALENIWNEGRK